MIFLSRPGEYLQLDMFVLSKIVRICVVDWGGRASVAIYYLNQAVGCIPRNRKGMEQWCWGAGSQDGTPLCYRILMVYRAVR